MIGHPGMDQFVRLLLVGLLGTTRRSAEPLVDSHSSPAFGQILGLLETEPAGFVETV